MRRTQAYAVALVTAPSLPSARALAQTILRRRLAACVNLIRSVESHFRWKGRLEASDEILLVIKSSRKSLAALERCVLDHHPYDTPEFIALPIIAGSKSYLDWMSQSLS